MDTEVTQSIAEAFENIRPMTGRVLVKLEPVEPFAKKGLIWVSNLVAKDQRYRKGGVASVSRGGRIKLGGAAGLEHSVAAGDRVLVDRQAAKDISGGAGMKPGTLVSIWDQYVLATVTENEKGDIVEIQPLHDRIVLKRLDESNVTKGGIIIPASAQEKSDKGEVIAIGGGRILPDGTQRPLDIKVGDVVLFGKYAGTEVKVDDQDRIIVKEDDVLAVLPKEAASAS